VTCIGNKIYKIKKRTQEFEHVVMFYQISLGLTKVIYLGIHWCENHVALIKVVALKVCTYVCTYVCFLFVCLNVCTWLRGNESTHLSTEQNPNQKNMLTEWYMKSHVSGSGPTWRLKMMNVMAFLLLPYDFGLWSIIGFEFCPFSGWCQKC
jgi:hypothetical protein